MKFLITLVIAIIISVLTVSAQDEAKVSFSGYLESYYGYDYNKPVDNKRPGFVYSHNRHNEINLNLGFIKGAYNDGKVRANLAFMAGTYSNANLAAEPGVLKNIFEANAGLKLSKTSNLWLEAGIFASHIGFESAISKDCWVLTRNIVSDNTPYYESGAKINYTTPDNKFTAAGLYLNGWQRIQRQSGNSQPAGGLQLTYRPNDKITLNYSNYVGTEGEDALRVRRFYNNLYGIVQITDAFGITAGFDYGTQQKSRASNETNEVFSPVLIAQYKFNPKWALAGRFEYYEDANGVIIPTGTPNGFQTRGYSANVDYWPVNNAVLRLEGKIIDSKDKIFVREGNHVNHNATVTASIAVSF